MRFARLKFAARIVLLSPALYGWAAEYSLRQIPGSFAAPGGYFEVAINSKEEVLIFGASRPPYLWSEKSGPQMILPDIFQHYFSAFHLNDKGEVAGLRAFNGKADLIFWSAKDGAREISAPTTEVQLVGFNESGELAGNVTLNGHTRAFVATAENGIRYLASPSATDTVAAAINKKGEVVGTMLAQCTGTRCPVDLARHAFVWSSKTGLRDLGTIQPNIWPETIATDVNASGDVVGYLTGPDNSHPFLWTEKTGIQELGCPARVCTQSWLADRGVVVGMYVFALSFTRGFIWTPQGGMRDLGGGTYQGPIWLETYPVAIKGTNGRGEVVGWTYFGPRSAIKPHAFVWTQATGVVDLDPGSNRVSVAYGVNDRGVVVGVVDGRASIWTPKTK